MEDKINIPSIKIPIQFGEDVTKEFQKILGSVNKAVKKNGVVDIPISIGSGLDTKIIS